MNVGIIGAGLIGERRALEAHRHPATQCVVVCDVDEERARLVAAQVNATVETDWRAVVDRDDIDIIVIATPNKYMAEIAREALYHGRHVLSEKPMGRNINEAYWLYDATTSTPGILKIGFNHRYHPAIAEAHRRVTQGDIGAIINIRCRYGHGGRPGYENEWRGNKELAGGGELTDQGVHVMDLIHWFAGVPKQAFGVTQTAVWPLNDLEDNGFGTFTFESGTVVQFHTSWTQWKNLFSFEIFGTKGSIVVEGLGKSYGLETLTAYTRNPAGGPPQTERIAYDEDDMSWQREWSDFITAIQCGTPMQGTADDGLIAMRMLSAIYHSHTTGALVTL